MTYKETFRIFVYIYIRGLENNFQHNNKKTIYTMKRFIILKEGIEIGRFQTVKEAANVIGCGFQHIYKNVNGLFNYKKINYQLIDRLTQLD